MLVNAGRCDQGLTRRVQWRMLLRAFRCPPFPHHIRQALPAGGSDPASVGPFLRALLPRSFLLRPIPTHSLDLPLPSRRYTWRRHQRLGVVRWLQRVYGAIQGSLVVFELSNNIANIRHSTSLGQS